MVCSCVHPDPSQEDTLTQSQISKILVRLQCSLEKCSWLLVIQGLCSGVPPFRQHIPLGGLRTPLERYFSEHCHPANLTEAQAPKQRLRGSVVEADLSSEAPDALRHAQRVRWVLPLIINSPCASPQSAIAGNL